MVFFWLAHRLPLKKPGDAAFTVHVVQRGENLFRIALAYDLFAEDIAAANGITDSDSIAVGQRLIIPLAIEPQQRVVHFVSSGETLASIASDYGTTVAALMSLNSLTSSNLIYVGQELTILAGQDAASRLWQKAASQLVSSLRH